jgi:tungstate transport system substrate-binding protein
MKLFARDLAKFKRSLAIVIVSLFLSFTNAFATNGFIVVASTTSTVNSGLFKNILPIFTKTTGISVRVLGVGTGQAIKVAERGDADILFVHHKISEVEFVKKAFGVKRYDVMYNDFIVVGPQNDPADVQNSKNVVEAYEKVLNSGARYLSI